MEKLNEKVMYRQCCVCLRFLDADGKYMEVELMPGDGVTHTYCTKCFDEAMEELKS